MRDDDDILGFSESSDETRSDDEIIAIAAKQITDWQAAGAPGFDAVQELFYTSVRFGASAMVRDKIIDVLQSAFGMELGGKRAMISTWNTIQKEFNSERAQSARNSIVEELTPEQKAKKREALWPSVRELAEAPDLMERVVRQVQAMGVVNEHKLIILTYITATSRVLKNPINVLTKGASSGGKSFTTMNVLELIGSDYVNKLTSSSALSLVYDVRPLAHKIIFLFEANQLKAEKQADKDSTFAMLVRTLISEGKLIHQTTVEDPDSPTGRRVEVITREGPIAFIATTTGTIYDENETRMLAWHIHEDHKQTTAVMEGIADRAAGIVTVPKDLAVWHDLQHWLSLGPNEVVVPFARQIANNIQPLMVRFRRDIGALFNFIKASAVLHQAQRQVDAHGRIVATVADYALAYPIFSLVMAETSGKAVPSNVKEVVKLIAERAGAPTKEPEKMRFTRVEVAGRAVEVTISYEQIGTATGIGRSAAYRAVRTAIDLGFLVNNEIRKGKPPRLVLKRGVDDIGPSLLPAPKTIETEGSAS